MATVEALLYRIAINLAASKRRRAKLWRWASLDALRSHAVEQPSIEDTLVSAATRQDVRAAIESLPESLRRTLVLCELTSLTHEQVGRILHIPAGTVGSRRHRAVQLLRERLSVTEE